jgi:homoserine kinase type II
VFPAGVSMLWEQTDPQVALRDRFGLDTFDDASRWLAEVLAQRWDIDVAACDRILVSGENAIAWVWADHGALVAKWSRARDEFDRLAATSDLLAALDGQGVPMVPPLAAIDGRYRVLVESGSAPLSMMVQPRIEGDLLDIADGAAVRRAGACLAALHGALAAYSDNRLGDATPDLRHRIESWLDEQYPGTVPAASARLREQLAALPRLDRDPQLIHGDYRASNIITTGSEIVAVIDFDGVALDHCVSEVAKAFVYLGTHFTNWRPTPAPVRELLLEGYESVRPLTPSEHRWLEALTLWHGIVAIPSGADPAGWAAALHNAAPPPRCRTSATPAARRRIEPPDLD